MYIYMAVQFSQERIKRCLFYTNLPTVYLVLAIVIIIIHLPVCSSAWLTGGIEDDFMNNLELYHQVMKIPSFDPVEVWLY
jgi:hypothetical protein